MKKFIISLLVICTAVLTAPVSVAYTTVDATQATENIQPIKNTQYVETTAPEVELQDAPAQKIITQEVPIPEVSEQEPMAVKTKKEKKAKKEKKEKNKKQKVKKPKQKKVIKDEKTESTKTSKEKVNRAYPQTVQPPKKRSKLAQFLNPNLDIMEVRASHILVKKRKDAVRIRKDIINGTISFEDAAREYSLCPTGMRGGDLGYFSRKKMEQLFADVAFDLKVGEISDPVGTKFGWHIIKVVDKR